MNANTKIHPLTHVWQKTPDSQPYRVRLLLRSVYLGEPVIKVTQNPEDTPDDDRQFWADPSELTRLT